MIVANMNPKTVIDCRKVRNECSHCVLRLSGVIQGSQNPTSVRVGAKSSSKKEVGGD